MTSLDTVILFTSQMEQLAGFYEEALGLELSSRGPQHRGASLDNGVYFGIDQVPEVAGRSDGGGTSLWFNVDNLAKAYATCVAAGAGIRYPPELKPMGAELASLIDPDGNVFGLVQRSD